MYRGGGKLWLMISICLKRGFDSICWALSVMRFILYTFFCAAISRCQIFCCHFVRMCFCVRPVFNGAFFSLESIYSSWKLNMYIFFTIFEKMKYQNNFLTTHIVTLQGRAIWSINQVIKTRLFFFRNTVHSYVVCTILVCKLVESKPKISAALKCYAQTM